MANFAFPMTDYANWRLKVEHGRQVWHYLEDPASQQAWPQSNIDKYWLGILKDLPDLPKPVTTLDSARNGLQFYRRLQTDDGHFAGEYGGPMFLIPGIAH